jgi:hypothetical protein
MNAQDCHKLTPMHVACSCSSRNIIVPLLLEYTAEFDINAVDRKGNTSLHLMCSLIFGTFMMKQCVSDWATTKNNHRLEFTKETIAEKGLSIFYRNTRTEKGWSSVLDDMTRLLEYHHFIQRQKIYRFLKNATTRMYWHTWPYLEPCVVGSFGVFFFNSTIDPNLVQHPNIQLIYVMKTQLNITKIIRWLEYLPFRTTIENRIWCREVRKRHESIDTLEHSERTETIFNVLPPLYDCRTGIYRHWKENENRFGHYIPPFN